MADPIDWGGYAQRKAQEKAAINQAQGDAVSPQAAIDAIRIAPEAQVPPDVGMQDPEPLVAQARQRQNTSHLEASPPLTSFVASSPAKAAAVSDDYGSLAKIGSKLNEWNATATEDFFAPGKASGRALLRDAHDWFTSGPEKSPLALIPGFSEKDKKLGGVLADLFGVAVSPITGALNAAARPLSAIPSSKLVDGKFVPLTQPERQAQAANILGTALAGLGAGGLFRAPPIRPGPVNEGLVGQRLRLTGPKEEVPNAVFEDFKAPGVEPAHTPVYGAVAEMDAAQVTRLQEAVAESQTHTRAPALMEDYLENHTDAGGQVVAVPADTVAKLWADGHNVFADQQTAIQDALISGSDLQIPLSTYLTETAGKPFAEDLNAAVRFRENGVSIEEVKDLPTETPGYDVYHGSAEPIDEFDISQTREEGGWFFKDRAALEDSQYGRNGRVVSTHRINPQKVYTPTMFEQATAVAGGGYDDYGVGALLKKGDQFTGGVGARNAIARKAKEAGYDAIDWSDAGHITVLDNKAFVRKPKARAVELPEDVGPEFAEGVRTIAAKADSVVEQVFKEAALDKLFLNPKAAGMTEGQMSRYSARVEEAQAALHDRLLQRTYNQIRRERTPEWKEQVVQRFAEAEQTVAADPALQAYSALRSGKGTLGEPIEAPFKLSSEDQIALHGKDQGLPSSMFSRNGLMADDVAELLGFPNGLKLMESLVETHAAVGDRTVREFVKDETQALAEQANRETLGYDISPEGMLEAARELVASPEIEDVLIDTLKDFAAERGLPFDAAAVKDLAKSQFDKLPVKEAIRTRAFVDNMRRLGNKAEVALMDDKDLKAFQFKQQQLLQYHQVAMSTFLAKKYGIATRKFAKLARRKTIQGMAQPYLDQLHSYLPRVGFPSKRNVLELGEALGGVTVEDFVSAVISVNSAFPEVPRTEGNLPDLQVQEFWAVREFVYAMDKFGREVQTLKTVDGRADFEATVERFLANAPPAKGGGPPRMGGHKNFYERQAAKLRGYDASHRKIADIGEFFDRGKADGVMAQVLEYPIEEASNKDGKLRRETYQPVNDAFYTIPEATRNTYNGIIPAEDHPFTAPDGTPMELRRGDVPAIALYVGQESALAKLAEGYNTTPMDVLQFLDEHMTAPEVQFVQKVWDQFEELSAEVSAELRAMTGTGLQKEANRPWVTPHGTVKGGYWPVRYDKALDSSALDREAARAAQVGLDPVNQFFANVVPNKGFSVQRTGYKGPVLIRLSEVAGAFDAHIKYASYAQTVASIRRFINDKRVRATISNRMGPEYYEQFNPWLDAIVLDYTISDKGSTALQAIAHQLRINTTMSVLGFSYTTGISQIAGLSGSMGVLGDNLLDGTLRMAHGMAKFGRIMASGGMRREIFAKSEFMAQRFGEVEPNMVAAINATQGLSFTGGKAAQAYKKVQNAGLAYIGWAEFLTVSGPTWVAAREKALGQLNMSEGDATRYADRVVRKAQGSGRRVDLAAVQRGEGFQRWFYMFNTFFNAQYQRMIETGREAGQGNYGKAFALFAGFFILPPLLANLLTNHGPKDGKAGTVSRWAAQSIFFNLFRPMYGLGNLTSVVDRNLTAQNGKWTMRPARDFDFSADPMSRMAQAIVKGAESSVKLAQGKKGGRPVQNIVAGIGIPLGIPGSVQIGRTGEYMYELTTGQQKPKGAADTIKGLLVGPQQSQGKTSTSTPHGGSHK
jgi:hypothetical protein